MNSQQRNSSLYGLAAVITKRIVSVRQLHAERGESPAAEVAHQFLVMARGARLQDGPVTTAEMSILADMLPQAIEQYVTRYPTSTVQHQPHRLSEKSFCQSQAA
jgi:hypothetical protein